MLQFPENYFKSEERSGYRVGESVKRVWASQLEILHKIAEICEKYNLVYYIFWGSLLGAVRHQGIIPWDDDIDIAMLGDHYIRFLEVAKDELPEAYWIFNPYTDDTLDMHFTRITNRKEIDLQGDWSREFHGCPLSMGIDIFPLYYIPKDKEIAEEQKAILTYIRKVRDIINYRRDNPEQNEQEKKEYDLIIAQSLVDVQNMTGYQFTSARPLNRQLDMLFDQICRIATREESECVASFDEYIVNNRRIFPLSYFDNPIQLPFENITVTAPKEYDAILKDVYGDYMIPRNFNLLDEHAAVKMQMQTLGNYIESKYFVKKNNGNAISIKEDNLYREGISYEQAEELLPSDWFNKIYVTNSDGEVMRKKLLLYYIAVDKIMLHSAHVVDKMKRTLEIFQKQSDVVIWWMPSMAVDDLAIALNDFIPETLEGYKEMVKEYISQNVGIYDESGDILRALNMSDAYYGDEGFLVTMFIKMNKPVMIQNYQV